VGGSAEGTPSHFYGGCAKHSPHKKEKISYFSVITNIKKKLNFEIAIKYRQNVYNFGFYYSN